MIRSKRAESSLKMVSIRQKILVVKIRGGVITVMAVINAITMQANEGERNIAYAVTVITVINAINVITVQ